MKGGRLVEQKGRTLLCVCEGSENNRGGKVRGRKCVVQE
jgi:hypothetical protein